jgi:hypothetical protein
MIEEDWGISEELQMMRDFLEGLRGENLRSFYFLDSGDASPCVRDHSSIDDADRRLFLAEIVRRPVARPIFNSPSVNSLSFYFYFWILPRSQIHLTCVCWKIQRLCEHVHCAGIPGNLSIFLHSYCFLSFFGL